MPRLSAIDAIRPAFEQMQLMLFRRFSFKTWLKIGFIGWLAGGASFSGNFNYRVPSFPGSEGGDVGKDAARMIRSFLSEHMLLIIIGVAFIMFLGLIFFYLSCRFRFILFDSVLQKDADIGRGWARYGRPAHRYLGFMIAWLLVSWALLALILVPPFWRIYKNGIFGSDNPFPDLFRILAPALLGVFVFVIVGAIVTSLAHDFGVPLLALDDLTIGDAWSQLRQMISAEFGAFAGYLGMKLVLSIGAGIVVAIASVIIFVVLLIPGVILAVVGVVIAKAAGPVVGIILAVIGVFVGIALTLSISMLVTAPVAVFFTAYSFYFLGGRYPKLGALLWPEPIAPPPSSWLPAATPPPPLPTA